MAKNTKMNKKVLTREELYLLLIENLKDEDWTCSKSDDGLVEIRFFVEG